MSAPRIGIAGLGAMGAPMADRLLAAGHRLTVWNRDPARAAAIVAAGATLAATPRALAEGSDIVLSVLFDDAAVEAVTLGPDGLAEGLNPDAIHLSCSTISPALADRLDAEHFRRGQRFAAAPLLGSAAAAASGALYLAASGPQDVLDRLQPVFSALAQRTMVVGARPRDAVVAKLANNFLLISLTEAMAEALSFSERAGLSRQAMMDLLWETDFARRIFAVYGRKVLDRTVAPPSAPTRLAAKDIDLVRAAAEQAGTVVPLAEFVRERLEKTIAAGWGEVDFAALALLADAESGIGRD